MGLLFVVFVLVFLVFFLGEHTGSQGAERAKREREVIAAKANLETKKSSLYEMTPPALVFVAVVAIIIVMLMLIGGWQDDDRYYHRHRH